MKKWLTPLLQSRWAKRLRCDELPPSAPVLHGGVMTDLAGIANQSVRVPNPVPYHSLRLLLMAQIEVPVPPP